MAPGAWQHIRGLAHPAAFLPGSQSPSISKLEWGVGGGRGEGPLAHPGTTGSLMMAQSVVLETSKLCRAGHWGLIPTYWGASGALGQPELTAMGTTPAWGHLGKSVASLPRGGLQGWPAHGRAVSAMPVKVRRCARDLLPLNKGVSAKACLLSIVHQSSAPLGDVAPTRCMAICIPGATRGEHSFEEVYREGGVPSWNVAAAAWKWQRLRFR